jgi:hypothetical protein
MAHVDIAHWWPKLSSQSREWLVEHNGEPLEGPVGADIASVHDNGTLDHRWFVRISDDGRPTQLSDSAVDWIEAVANEEDPAS